MAHAVRYSFLAFVLTLSAAAAANAQSTRRTTDPELEAIWHTQQLHFKFRSGRTSYACDTLERKVANILRALGARDDIAVDTGCFSGQFVSAAVIQVILAAPFPATAENVRTATTFDGRDKLVARMHGLQLPTATDIERFPAAWHEVSLSRHRLVKLDPSDCDLISAMSKQLFPRLAMRTNEKTFNCPSASIIRPRVEVTALLPIEATPLAFVAPTR